MADAILAIRFNGCSEEQSKFCLRKRSHNSCKEALVNCHFPMVENPLCLCKTFNECPRYYDIAEYDGKVYIIYHCENCPKFIGNLKDAIKTILEPKNDKNLYFGKDLDKLLKEIEYKVKTNIDVDTLAKYLERALKSVVTGV